MLLHGIAICWILWFAWLRANRQMDVLLLFQIRGNDTLNKEHAHAQPLAKSKNHRIYFQINFGFFLFVQLPASRKPRNWCIACLKNRSYHQWWCARVCPWTPAPPAPVITVSIISFYPGVRLSVSVQWFIIEFNTKFVIDISLAHRRRRFIIRKNIPSIYPFK